MTGLAEDIPLWDEPGRKYTERDMLDALKARYDVDNGNGPRYIYAEHVRCSSGFDARRTADFLALDTWASSGLRVIGHEVKVSRSDWLRELADPSKAATFTDHVDEWWLVVSDRTIVKPGELPDGWGLMALGSTGKLRAVTRARDLHPERPRHYAADGSPWPLPRGMTAAFFRAARRTTEREAS